MSFVLSVLAAGVLLVLLYGALVERCLMFLKCPACHLRIGARAAASARHAKRTGRAEAFKDSPPGSRIHFRSDYPVTCFHCHKTFFFDGNTGDWVRTARGGVRRKTNGWNPFSLF